jgi:peptidoglycan biosynthesis protein MviN/MurJ (putative lipid II flippase)
MTETAPRKSLARRVMRAGIAVGIAHLLFKLAGIVQAWAMARYLPAEVYDASYVVAFEGVIFSLFLIGEESLAPACLPTFMSELDNVGERAAWRFASTLLVLQGLVLLAVVAVLVAFPGWITRIWTHWSEATHPEAFTLAASSVRRMAPGLIGLSLGSTTYVLLNAYKRFFLAAAGDALWKFVVAGALIAGTGAAGAGGRGADLGHRRGQRAEAADPPLRSARQAAPVASRHRSAPSGPAAHAVAGAAAARGHYRCQAP